MSSEYVVEMQDINMSFSCNQVLKDVSFCLKKGELHSLIGANGAGKSTLIKILNGIYPPVSGTIQIGGVPVQITAPKDAESHGLAFVHQELNVCEHLSVAENMYIGNLVYNRRGLYDRRETANRARALLDRMQIDLDVNQKLMHLRNAEKQIVEILKALTHDASVLVLDEPTSSLNEREKENFFRIVNNLKQSGVSILFISHFLEDVIALSDRVTALKDGINNGVFEKGQLDKEQLIVAMMGRNIRSEPRPKQPSAHTDGPAALEVRNLCSRKKFEDISFRVDRGSVVGVCGLLGAGKTEIARAIFGMDPFDSGEVLLHGQRVSRPSPAGMVDRHAAFLTEDRKMEGLIPLLSIRENTTLSITRTLQNPIGVLDRKRQRALAEQLAADVTVKMASIEQPVGKLSGGNQQKVIIARCLATKPQVFLLDEPTRGVDVYAKSEIYRILQQAAAGGTAVIVFSSELEELLENCRTIIVLKQGRISTTVDAAEITKHDLLAMIG